MTVEPEEALMWGKPAPPQVVEENTDAHGSAFTVSVDAVGTGTGISAADRSATIRALADPATTPGDLRRPDHVFPLRAVPGGVLERRGHTEAAVELVRMAGLAPVAPSARSSTSTAGRLGHRPVLPEDGVHLLPTRPTAASITTEGTRAC